MADNFDYESLGISGRPARLHHVGFAFPSLDAGSPIFADVLGLQHIGDDSVPGTEMRFFDSGQCLVQVLHSTGTNKSIEAMVERQGGGVHHLAFAVDDVDKALKLSAAAGCKLIDEVKRQGSRGTRVGFINPAWPGDVLIEFVEDPNFTY